MAGWKTYRLSIAASFAHCHARTHEKRVEPRTPLIPGVLAKRGNRFARNAETRIGDFRFTTYRKTDRTTLLRIYRRSAHPVTNYRTHGEKVGH